MAQICNPLRSKVLNMYRRIFRERNKWQGDEADKVVITREARKLFRKNKDISDPEKIKRKLEEAELRIELALHYKIPYPRPYNATGIALSELRNDPSYFLKQVGKESDSAFGERNQEENEKDKRDSRF
eukprot:TRINITY_DN5526_c0_g1_i1.p1 TRINITY_DN5526_c0_g1~~TRINITY_DN5526_c0_g1_i1.p1  ORF type:complete len:150 (+),score=37.89 TRINITY_DN5526_c0_g1_i1:67-450(+)